PFDIGNIGAITSSIRDNQSLGLNPMDDGRVVRVPVPALTEERRKDLAKQSSSKLEECMIALRSIRHEALDAINKSKKDKEIGEDEGKRLIIQIEEEMGKARQSAEASAKSKEQEIMTV
ncbi:MAG: ribosome-recycling factor, partial [Candidatus Saccharibacteria bacterium]